MQLLKKTITAYFIFSVILLLITIPVLYWTLKRLMVANVDENLIATKTRIMPQLLDAAAGNREGILHLPGAGYDILLEKEGHQPNGHLQQPAERKTDSLYNGESIDSYPGRTLPNRLLASHFYINQESYSLRITASLADKYLLIQRIVLVSALLLIALLVGLLVINRMLTKKIWQPFYNTLQRLREYRVDRQPRLTLQPSTISEFNDLNTAIEQLAERNYQVYSSQKEFTENASHEMQSPLAVFQSKLELLMQTKPLNEDQAALITDLANASKRMARLNKSLILLTKIDNDQFIEKETISVKEVLQKLIQQYEFQIQQQGIHLRFENIEDITLTANRTLVEILLSNLLSNAIRHNLPGGSIEISLQTKDKELTIRNTGRPSPLDTQKLFQRFQKESSDANSIGLGLEIVKKITNLNHFSIRYSFTSQLHTFSLRF
ncbi:MAG: HAMP domain-containing sensor histidine kinase [Bacteroidota bacterium]